MSSPSSAMQNASAAWYLAVCQAFNMSGGDFQLLGGTGLPLGDDLASIWQIFDTIPAIRAISDSSNFAGSRATFSSSYGDLLQSLQDPPSNALEKDMGELYEDWQSWSENYAWKASDTFDSVFTTWAHTKGLQPSQIAQFLSDADASLPVTTARSKYNAVTDGVFAYDFNLDEIVQGLDSSPAQAISLSSSNNSSSLQQTWAHGAANYFGAIFDVASGTTYSNLDQRIQSAGVSVSGQFDHFYVLDAQPLSEPSTLDEVSGRKAWYSPDIVSKAYVNQDNHDELWKDSNENPWADYFGPSGSLAYAITGLVIIDGFDITVSAELSLSTDEQTDVQHATEGGIFPFFFGRGEASYTSSTTSATDSGFSTVLKGSPGNPQILGARVLPASEYTG